MMAVVIDTHLKSNVNCVCLVSMTLNASRKRKQTADELLDDSDSDDAESICSAAGEDFDFSIKSPISVDMIFRVSFHSVSFFNHFDVAVSGHE